MALAADPAGAIIQANMEPTGLQLRGTAQNFPGDRRRIPVLATGGA